MISILPLFVSFFALINIFIFSPPPAVPAPSQTSVNVLGVSNYAPTVFISNSSDGYNVGGVLSQSSLDEPAISLHTYDSTGPASLDIYQASIKDVLSYLTYDSESKQKLQFDSSQLTKVTSLTTNISSSGDNRLLLPIQGEGIWYLKIKFGNNENSAFLIRSEIEALVKEGDNKVLFWVQNLTTKKTVTTGVLELFNLLDSPRSLIKSGLDGKGVTSISYSPQTYDVAILTSDNHTALIPINMRYLNYGNRYNQFLPKSRVSRYFIFTDRPLYKPGDTVYYKAVIRDDNDVRYSIPKGTFTVKAFKDWNEQSAFFTQTHTISDKGTITGELTLPVAQGTGNFQISIKNSNPDTTSSGWEYYDSYGQDTTLFQVEYFRKPEYTLDISTPYTEYVAGDQIEFTVSGAYFSGAPLTQQNVKYSLYSSNYYEYEYLFNNQNLPSDSKHYGYWYGNKIQDGELTLNGTGQASFLVPSSDSRYKSTRSQIFSLEAQFNDESGNPVLARKNILVYPAEFNIFRRSGFYTGQTNRPFVLPIILKSIRGSRVNDLRLSATILRESWIALPLTPGQKYPSYVKETENLPPLSSTTNSLGEAQFTFTPVKTGSYTFTISGTDQKGNVVSKNMYIWISDISRPAPTGQYYEELKIETDYPSYQPSDKVNLKIWSDIPERDLLLTWERGRVNRWQIIKLSGQSSSFTLPLEYTDIPNIYLTVSGFSESTFVSDTENINISPESQRLNIKISPNLSRYGPGQSVVLEVQTTNQLGKPVSADLAVWAVDKAIFELSDSNINDIFNRFWSVRGNQTDTSHSLEGIMVNTAEGGGCFTADTQILMAGGLKKSISDVKRGDTVLTRVSANNPLLTKARVLSIHSADVDGIIILNSRLKVTPNHLLWVNNSWKTASQIQKGDLLSDFSGSETIVTSVEWQSGKIPVYNLKIADYHTFFAEGIWVHNDKGDGSARSVFKDTAYWNPTVTTDRLGQARVVFKLPDNLTTWTIAAIGSTADTQVGQTTTEIISSKEVIIRPVLPNLIRIGDKLRISALVHNFTDVPQDFTVGLNFDSGQITPPATHPQISILPNNFRSFNWIISPDTVNPAAKLKFTAQTASGKSDAVQSTLPVIPFGFMETNTRIGNGNQSYPVDFPPDADLSQSSLILSLASNILGTLPSAMKYLIDYPYGCIEQTTSRLIPAIITKSNLDIFYDALDQKDITKIISSGLDRLSALKSADGGWGWWHSVRNSDPFITSYVLEYLFLAKSAGIEVPDELIKPAVNFLKSYNPKDDNSRVYKIYGLNLAGEPEGKEKLTNFDAYSPVSLAYAVISNAKNGDQNPDSNGLKKLLSLYKTLGDNIYWEKDSQSAFPSLEASTAISIRAIILGGGDRELAVKAARYLLGNRKSNYWANTFATAQIIRSITDLHRTGGEADPNFSYTFKFNDNLMNSSQITSSVQLIKDTVIPSKAIKIGSNKFDLSFTGTGQIYSTLIQKTWRTDKKAAPQSHTISLSRKYVNDKGEDYTLGIGDSVSVILTVSGLSSDSRYLVIEDYLPSGLIPVNTNLLNEKSDNDYSSSKEYTANGAIIFSSLIGNATSYSYKARVISQGESVAPPALAQLMYQPEVNALSETSTLITEEFSRSTKTPVENITRSIKKFSLSLSQIIILGLLIVIPPPFIFFAIKIIKHRHPPHPME